MSAGGTGKVALDLVDDRFGQAMWIALARVREVCPNGKREDAARRCAFDPVAVVEKLQPERVQVRDDRVADLAR